MKHINATDEIMKLIKSTEAEDGFATNGLFKHDDGRVEDIIDKRIYNTVQEWAATVVYNDLEYNDYDDYNTDKLDSKSLLY